MKKIIIAILFTGTYSLGVAQSADEVIQKFVIAIGGNTRLNAIKTLQYVFAISVKTPMGDYTVPTQVYKDNNKLFRTETAIPFAEEGVNFFTLISDTAGYIMMPPMPIMGVKGGLQKLTTPEVAAQAYQKDAAGFFASLIHYKRHGFTAQFLGVDSTESIKAYKIKIEQPNGIETTYFIDSKHNLVVRTDTKGEGAAGLGGGMPGISGIGETESTNVTTIYNDWQQVAGVQFPATILIKHQLGDAQGSISNIKINEPINQQLYKP